LKTASCIFSKKNPASPDFFITTLPPNLSRTSSRRSVSPP
jgi:hypothetical protein